MDGPRKNVKVEGRAVGMKDGVCMSLSSMGQGNDLPRSKSNPPLGRPARRHRPTTPFLIRRYNGLDEGVQPAKSQRNGKCEPGGQHSYRRSTQRGCIPNRGRQATLQEAMERRLCDADLLSQEM
jgi:hypothetical protein